MEVDFRPAYLEWVASFREEEYYLEMMQAWFFCDAMIKQYEDAVFYLEEDRLSPEVHRMTIQKCIDSRRISPERKDYLKSLRKSS